MKILCDVCGKGEASFYCIADEASLCSSCDHRVHHANKLAGKHHRFSLLHPSPNHSPLCDICQERSAFLFCQQDRAILCRECDISIHKANPHTHKHTRFLLTGVRISAAPVLYSESPAQSDAVSEPCTPPTAKGTTPPACTPPTAKDTAAAAAAAEQDLSHFSTSSISEYLIETLPGWHVEDLLDSSSPSPSPFSKSGADDLVLPFWDADFQNNSICNGFAAENMGFWVPQVQNQSLHSSLDNSNSNYVCFGLANGSKDLQTKEFSTNSIKTISRKRSEDNSFAVPQISPSISKRSKSFW